MPRTPDYFPGEREEETLLILSGSELPAKNGEITYVSGTGFKFYEEGVVKTLSSGSEGSNHFISLFLDSSSINPTVPGEIRLHSGVITYVDDYGLTFTRANTMDCVCLASDVVGSPVFVTGSVIAGKLSVTSCDSSNPSMMPAIGLIISKSSPTIAQVCLDGLLSTSWGSFYPGAVYYVARSGSLTTGSSIVSGDVTQPILFALSSNLIKVLDSFVMVHSIPVITTLSSYGTNWSNPALPLTVYVTGSGYDRSSIVNLNTNPLVTSYVNDRILSCIIPSTVTSVTGAYALTVRNPPLLGGVSNVISYSVGSGLVGVSPSNASQFASASMLTVNGLFSTGSQVRINNVVYTTLYVSDSTLKCTLPAAGSSLSIFEDPATYIVDVIDLLSASTNTASITVSRYPNENYWIRADKGITLNGSKVFTWADQSGTADNNKLLSQSVSARQPTWNSSNATYNNKSTVTFPSAQGMPGVGTWLTSTLQPLTVYVVGNASSSYPSYAFCTKDAAPNYVVYGWTTNCWSAYVNSTRLDSVISASIPSIVCAIYANESSAIYVNNVLTASAVGSLSSVPAWNSNAVGAYTGQASNSLKGPLAEVLLFSGSHDSNKRNEIMGYLARRYGLTASGSF